MLQIESLKASIEGTPILKGLSMKVNAGEIHAIMGPNGSGKSTLSKVIAGHPDMGLQEIEHVLMPLFGQGSPGVSIHQVLQL